MTGWAFLAVLVLALGTGSLAAGPVQAQEAATVVVSGLDAPRGLALGPDGWLYVAEAGRGGEDRIDWPRPFEFALAGSTGRITRVSGDRQLTVVSGLQSLALGPGSEVIGPADLAFVGRDLYLLIGELNANPGGRPTSAVVARVDSDGSVEPIADLGEFEQAHDPDGLGLASNPWGLAVGANGRLYVADAGANALLEVTTDGQIEPVAVWPTNPVPTDVAIDPSGQVYVSFLSPFAFNQGSARVDRIATGGPVVAAPGLTGVVDLAFGPDGALYVLEFSEQFSTQPAPPRWRERSGRILRIGPNAREVIYSGLNFPTKLLFDPSGGLYVTNNAAFSPPGSGEVLWLPAERVAARGQPATPPMSPLPEPTPAPTPPAAAPPPGETAGAPPERPAGPPSGAPPPAQAPPPSAPAVQVPAQLPKTGLAAGAGQIALAGLATLLAGLALRQRGRPRR